MFRRHSLLFLLPFLFAAPNVLFAQAQAPAAQPGAAPGKPAAPASVTGRVLRKDGAPLPKATVSLLPEARGAEVRAVRVNSSGVFEFAEVAPGRYRLAAERNGFVRQTYGQRGGGPGVTLDIQPGQRLTDIELRLERAGVISGNVTDEDGEPVEGVQVFAQRVRFVAGGFQRINNARTARTDDLGNYRLPSLAPGYYFVRAAGRAEGSVSIGGPPAAISYAPTYFPGVPTRDEAQKVQVRAGAESPRIDLRVRTAATYTISGIIVDATAGTSPRRYSFGFSSGGGTALRSTDRNDGTFELRGIEPGEYTILGVVNPESGPSRRGYRKVFVSDSDVRVVIEIGRTAELRGRVRRDHQDSISLAGLSLQLAADDESSVSSFTQIKEDATFQAEGVPEGEYRIDLSGRTDDVYLQQITCGGQDYTNRKIALVADQVVDDCEVVLARDGATLNAFVADSEKPAQGVVVVAVPQSGELRRRARNTVTGQTDVNGFAALRGLIPGEYYVFAVAPSDDAPYYDVAFPERNRETAVTLTAKPKEQHALSLKVTEPK